MATLAPPMELLEMGDNEVRVLTVESFEVGEATITPRDGRGPKTITVVRVHVPREGKALFPFYWDLTASTLVAQVRPILEAARTFPVDLEVVKYGVAPRARFSVAVRARA